MSSSSINMQDSPDQKELPQKPSTGEFQLE